MYTLQTLFITGYSVPFEASLLSFDCIASSVFKGGTCDNIFYPGDGNRLGWVAKGNGVGEWIQIQFNNDIVISKLIYTHAWYGSMKKDDWGWSDWSDYNQAFKEVSFEFSDQSHTTVTLPDISDEIHLSVDPPKLSSTLKITAQSVYKHSKVCEPGTNKCKYQDNRYGIFHLRVYGVTKEGKCRINYII